MRRPLFIDTVTIYNHYRLGREDAWARTVLRGVQVKRQAVKGISDGGRGGVTGAMGVVTVGEAISVTIPENVDAGGKRYLSPGAFAGVANKSGAWTLAPGTNMDVLVLGVCEQEITEAYTLASLRADHPGEHATIKSAKDARGRLLPHWEVVAT